MAFVKGHEGESFVMGLVPFFRKDMISWSLILSLSLSLTLTHTSRSQQSASQTEHPPRWCSKETEKEITPSACFTKFSVQETESQAGGVDLE
jgi:hypothetical protein